MFAVAFCGINGALEMPMSCVVGGGVAKAVSVALKKNAATVPVKNADRVP